MKNIYIGLIFLFSISLYGQAEGSKDIERQIRRYVEQLEKDSLMNTTTWSLMVKDVKTGTVIASHNPSINLTGASINKLLSTSVALRELGADFRYTTQLKYKGEIRDSVLYGSLYIVGGGDPTLGSGYDKFFPSVDSTFAIWTKELKQLGIARVEGEIVADDRYFTAEHAQDTWTWDDLSTYYGTAVRGLSFYENIFNIKLTPSSIIGQRADIEQIYPLYPAFKFDNRTTSTDKGGRSVTLYTYPFHSDFQAVLGTVGQNAKSYTMSVANRMPGLSLAGEFYHYFTGQNIDTAKVKLRLIDSDSPFPNDYLALIYTHYSPTLREIVAVTNKYSDNMYADNIFRTLGKRFGKSDSTVDSRVALVGLLSKITDGTQTIKIMDGSGLSSQGFLNAKFYADYLAATYNSSIKDDFLYSLAIPGSEGTFKNTIKDTPTRNRLRLKSGTMTGVRGIVGYSMGDQSTLCFVVIVNKYHSLSPISQRLDKLLVLLSEY